MVALPMLASATTGWSTPKTLDVGGQLAYFPEVAVSADGMTQTVVWRRDDGTHNRVQVSTSSDHGATWSTVQTLSGAGQHAYLPQVALSTDGLIQTITWWRFDGANCRVQVVSSADSGATWSTVQTLTGAGQDTGLPEVAVSSDGAIRTVTWWRSDGTHDRVQVSSSSDYGATWSTPQTLDVGGQTAVSSEVAMSADGTTCLLYTSPSPRDQRGSRMPSSA